MWFAGGDGLGGFVLYFALLQWMFSICFKNKNKTSMVKASSFQC